MKSLKQCVQTLVTVNGGDGNFLFNVGPMPDGRIEKRQIDRLSEMGKWLEKYGESVYGTRGGPFKPGSWGASTCKDSRIYVHILDAKRNSLKLPAIGPKIKSVKMLTLGEVKYEQTAEGLTLNIDPKDMNEIDTIVAIDIEGDAFGIPPADVKN
jgi:alpha-L-fucosidase